MTFDANLNTTGLTNLPTQSWLGNEYQLGSAERIMPTGLQPALSFGTVVNGNLSSAVSATATSSGASSTAVSLVRAHAFLPYGLYLQPSCLSSNLGVANCTPPLEDPGDFTWQTQIAQAINPWEFAMDVRLYAIPGREASLSEFLRTATKTATDTTSLTNEVVAYFGHGIAQPDASQLNLDPTHGDPSVAMGLLFYDSQCLWFNDLLPKPPSPDADWPYFCISPRVSNVTQKPRVIFLAMCGFTSRFENDWKFDPTQQVMIYPVYGQGDTLNEMHIGSAAAEFLVFMRTLAKRKKGQPPATVQDALDAANAQAAIDVAAVQKAAKNITDPVQAKIQQNESWYWKADGNTNFTFSPSSH
jgi:hypothetical protein